MKYDKTRNHYLNEFKEETLKLAEKVDVAQTSIKLSGYSEQFNIGMRANKPFSTRSQNTHSNHKAR